MARLRVKIDSLGIEIGEGMASGISGTPTNHSV